MHEKEAAVGSAHASSKHNAPSDAPRSFDPHTFPGSAGLSTNASNQGIPPAGAPSGAGCV